MSNPLQQALNYAELGYPVFPCVPGRKHPLTQHGFHDATTDPERIEAWWTQSPTANIAIPTGGLVVIDVDGAGNAWLANLGDRQTDLMRGAVASTPGGGRHYIFRAPDNVRIRSRAGHIAPRVDVRAEGGYILVPPSVVGGKPYRFAAGLELEQPRERLPEPPAWLLPQLVEDAPSTPTAPRAASGGSDSNKIPSGQRNAALARLGGGMRRQGMSRDEILAALVCTNANRCTPPLPASEVERIATSVARYEPDQISVALAEDHYAQDFSQAAPDESPNDACPLAADPGPIPDELLSIPGFVNDVMQFTLETAPYPNRPLAFVGALALLGTLTGRKIREPGNVRTNVQILALASSGVGKDWPRKINASILLQADEVRKLAGKSSSGEGIEDRLARHPVLLKQDDEVDTLFENIRDNKESRYRNQLAMLLELYGEAGAWRCVRDRAGVSETLIHQPHLVLFGTTTPGEFYMSLSGKMLNKGLLARIITVEARERARGKRAIWKNPPEPIVAVARQWSKFTPAGWGNLSDTSSGEAFPLVAPIASDAQLVFDEFSAACDARYAQASKAGCEPVMAIWARAVEKSLQLALIHACSEHGTSPVVEKPAAQWACRFVEHTVLRTIFMLGQHFHENDFEQRCQAVVATLLDWRRERGDAWMPYRDITRKHRWSRRDHDAVRESLEDQELIETNIQATSGRPRVLYRLSIRPSATPR